MSKELKMEMMIKSSAIHHEVRSTAVYICRRKSGYFHTYCTALHSFNKVIGSFILKKISFVMHICSFFFFCSLSVMDANAFRSQTDKHTMWSQNPSNLEWQLKCILRSVPIISEMTVNGYRRTWGSNAL